MNQNQIARLLKDFKAYPKTLRPDDGRGLKGYERRPFESIWSRYLPHTDIETVTPLQPAKTLTETHISNRDTEVDVTDANLRKSLETKECHAVTVQERERGVTEAEGEEPDWGAFLLVEARQRKGLPVKPELLESYNRWLAQKPTGVRVQ